MTVHSFSNSRRATSASRLATDAVVWTRRVRHRRTRVLIGRPWVRLLTEPEATEEAPGLTVDPGDSFPVGERRAA